MNDCVEIEKEEEEKGDNYSEEKQDSKTESVDIPQTQSGHHTIRTSCGSNSLSNLSGWSSQPVIHDESYDDILNSYSNKTCKAF